MDSEPSVGDIVRQPLLFVVTSAAVAIVGWYFVYHAWGPSDQLHYTVLTFMFTAVQCWTDWSTLTTWSTWKQAYRAAVLGDAGNCPVGSTLQPVNSPFYNAPNFVYKVTFSFLSFQDRQNAAVCLGNTASTVLRSLEMQQRRSFDDMTVLAWQTHVQETSIADIRRMTKQAWMDRAVPLLISEEDQKQRKAEDAKAVCVKHELRSGLQHLQAWLHDWTDDSLPITVGVLVLGARPGVEKFGSGRLIAVYETAGQYLTGHVVHCDSGLPVVTIELGRLLNGGTVFPKAYVDAASALLQVTLKAMRRQRGRDGRQESWAVITSAPTVGDLRQTHPWVVQEYPSLCAYDRACNRHVLATQIRRGDLLKVLGLELVFATSVLLANYLLKRYTSMLSDTWEHDMSEIWMSVLMGFFVFLTVASVINASAIGLLSLLGRMLCLCRFHYADFLLEVDCELGPNRYDSLKKRRRRERREQRARLAKDKKTQ